MVVTTAGKVTEQLVVRAKRVADELDIEYVPRKKQSIKKLQEASASGCIVVGKDRNELFLLGGERPFFFHPNSAMFRSKRLQNGEKDPFIEASKLQEGMSLLDCTLGLGSDSILASFVVGAEGKVVGLEMNEYLAYIVRHGLQTWDSTEETLRRAMQRIEVVHISHASYLGQLPDNSFDCVYFDPMFTEGVAASNGIGPLSEFASYEAITGETMKEALRVARQRVVLKDHFRSPRFQALGFSVFKRKSALFHYGVIEK